MGQIPAQSTPQLYYGYSIIASPSKPPIDVRWFRYDKRPQPVAPYDRLIWRYSTLTRQEQEITEDYVDELFTEEEAEMLRQYLRARHGWEMTIQRQEIPARYLWDEEMGRGTSSLRAATITGLQYPEGFLKLSEEEAYSLPFQVWGWYGPASGSVQPPEAILDHSDLVVTIDGLN